MRLDSEHLHGKLKNRILLARAVPKFGDSAGNGVSLLLQIHGSVIALPEQTIECGLFEPLPMNLVGMDSTPSLTLLSNRKNHIKDAVERVLTSSWSVRTARRPWRLSMSDRVKP